MSISWGSPKLWRKDPIANDPRLAPSSSKIGAYVLPDTMAPPPAKLVVGVVLADGRLFLLDPTTDPEVDAVSRCTQRLMRFSTAIEKILSEPPSTSPEHLVKGARS